MIGKANIFNLLKIYLKNILRSIMSSLLFDKLISYKHMGHKAGEELLAPILASPFV